MKKMIFTMLIASSVGLLAQIASAQTAQFAVTRDVGILGHGAEQASSAGNAPDVRAWKSNQNAIILDFDTAAMDAFLAANPGTATWTLNIYPLDTASHGLDVLTVESTNDWAEGDGEWTGANLNWTQGTVAATYLYAQTAHAGGEIDRPNSLQWIDPDSGTYTFTKRNYDGNQYGAIPAIDGNPTPEFTNSASFLAGDLVSDGLASVAIDGDIVNALITDTNNRGLRLDPYVNTGGSNFRMYTLEEAGKAPYLEVTVVPVPEPSSALLLLAGVGMLSRRRRR